MSTILFRNGRVHTPADPEATALAVTDGVVSWVGGEHAVSVVTDPDRVVDLDGALVIPGFVDAHVHTTDAGLALSGLDLTDAPSLSAALDAVAAHARRHPSGVLWGHGWDETRWPEGRPPTRAEFDRAVGPGRAAYVTRIDVHSALISSPLAAAVPDGPGLDGWSDDAPVRRAAHAAVRAYARTALPSEQRAAAQTAFLRHCAAQGIVEVHECAAGDAAGRADLTTLLSLAGQSGVAVRGYLAAPITDPTQAPALLADTGAAALGGDLVVDGALGSRTAALSAPYADDPGTHGSRYLTTEQITDHLVACTRAGVQAGFHAIGDDAVSAVAEGLRQAADRLDRDARGDGGPPGTVRLAALAHRVEHAEMPDAAAIDTFFRCGVIASVQPLFDALWGGETGMYAQRLGTARSLGLNPLAALAKAGVGLAFGSDAPVTPARPWLAVRAAVAHHTPGAGLSPRAAFTAHTRGGHRAAGRLDRAVGTLTPGATASLAVVRAGALVRPQTDSSVQRWSTDPRSRIPLLPDLGDGFVEPETVLTMVAGRVVHDRGLLGEADGQG